MNTISVFSKTDKRTMEKLGYKLIQHTQTVEGQDVWKFVAKELTFEDKKHLPQSAIVTDCVCINF